MTAIDPDGPRVAWQREDMEFVAFYRRQWQPMVRLAWSMLGSREEGEEVVQEAFVRLRPVWDGVEHPAAYLRTCVVNGVRGRQRRWARERRQPAPTEGSVWNPEIDEMSAVLARLPARQRHALALRFYADLPFEEIAGLLGCRVPTARTLVHRGLARMREMLGDGR